MRVKITLAVLAVATLFGLNVSGCNRNRKQNVASRQSRREAARTVRPAEVLSASAYRPPQHVYARAVPTSSQPAPAIAYQPQPQYAQPQYRQFARTEHPASPPQAPYIQPAISAPQMAMAQGYIAPAPAARPVQQQPQIQPLQYMPRTSVAQAPPTFYAHAPLPELEPARPYRLPVQRDSSRPVAEIMVSEGAAARRDGQAVDSWEVRQALAPLSSAPAPVAYGADSWVASPTTAMYQAPGRW